MDNTLKETYLVLCSDKVIVPIKRGLIESLDKFADFNSETNDNLSVPISYNSTCFRWVIDKIHGLLSNSLVDGHDEMLDNIGLLPGMTHLSRNRTYIVIEDLTKIIEFLDLYQ